MGVGMGMGMGAGMGMGMSMVGGLSSSAQISITAKDLKVNPLFVLPFLDHLLQERTQTETATPRLRLRPTAAVKPEEAEEQNRETPPPSYPPTHPSSHPHPHPHSRSSCVRSCRSLFLRLVPRVWLTGLVFEGPSFEAMESQFRDDLFRRCIGPSRRAMCAFICLWVGLGLIETFVTLPSATATSSDSSSILLSWSYRIPALLLGIVWLCLSWCSWSSRWFLVHCQSLTSFVWLLIGCLMCETLMANGTATEVEGITFMLLWVSETSDFIGLRFRYVAIIHGTVLLYYAGSALGHMEEFPLLFFFLFAAVVMSLTAAYSSESSVRLDFLRVLKLRLEEKHSRQFLDNMLPSTVIEEIKKERTFIAHERTHASVLFCDM